MTLRHEFVELVPDELDEGKVYVSIVHKTALHNCACGCGMEVVTPLSPTDWQMAFDGESISLHPSIGNWSFPCRSHYWIKNSEIVWATGWSNDRIDRGRIFDSLRKREHYAAAEKVSEPAADISSNQSGAKESIWNRLKNVCDKLLERIRGAKFT